MKTLNILATLSILIVLVVACATPTALPPPPEPTPTSEPSSPEPFTLTWWTELGATCCSDTRPDIIPQDVEEAGDLGEWLIDEWHALHPQYDHVTIEMILADTSNENAALQVRVAGGDTPHIIEGFAGRVGKFREIAVPVEAYFDKSMIDDYLPGRWEGLFHDGHIPMISAVGAFYYPVANATLFERAGLDIPTPWHQYTWEEFREIGEAVSALDDGSYLSCFFAGSPSGVQWDWELFAGGGVSMFENDDYSHVTFNTPAAVSILEDLVQLESDGHLAPGPTGLTIMDCVEYWKQGELAVFLSNFGSARSFMLAAVNAGIVSEEWEIVPLLPIAYGDATPLFVGGYYNQGVMIADATPDAWRTAAFSFAQYVSEWPFMINGPLRLPLLQSQIDRGAMPSGQEDVALAYILETGLAECGFSEPAFGEIRQLWVDEVSAAFLGVKTPEQALADFEVAVNLELR